MITIENLGYNSKFPKANFKFQISIFDLNGQEISKNEPAGLKTIIDISSLTCGVYIVRLVEDDSVEFKKFVKR